MGIEWGDKPSATLEMTNKKNEIVKVNFELTRVEETSNGTSINSFSLDTLPSNVTFDSMNVSK